MSRTIDYFIDSENDLASFEYYFEEDLNIKSVTLKSIMFYVVFVDFEKGILYQPGVIKLPGHYPIENHKEFNLSNFCDFLNGLETADHVKFHSGGGHLTIELLENKKFTLPRPYPDQGYPVFKEVFGFKQEEFIRRGKYRSPKSVIDTPPILFLRSNLVDKQNTFYNNKYSDILCHFSADDDLRKLRSYEPLNCTKNVYKRTNHLKFEITDENGKVINFRGEPVKIHLSFEVFPFNKHYQQKHLAEVKNWTSAST